MNKNDFDKLFNKYQPVLKKTGEQLAKAVKVAEEDLGKMYKIAQGHVELQMKNLQKEKLHHELGKFVADRLIKGNLKLEDLDKYKKRFLQLNAEGEKMKKKIDKVSKTAKGKSKSKTAKAKKSTEK